MSEVKNWNVKAKKKYGQNFLKDQKIVRAILDTAELNQDTAVIEIGPGLGALTEQLCQQAGFVLAYEIDGSLLPMLHDRLKDYRNYQILQQDILKADLKADIKTYLSDYQRLYVVANLPYYITTPIILGLLSLDVPIKRYVVMMQLEVANRICGKPKTKDYNALSIMVAYKAVAKRALLVPRTAFYPVPNVDSAVVRLDSYEQLPIQALDESLFYHILRLAFTQRRKTLYNNLILEYDKDYVVQLLQNLNLPIQIRAEALSLKDFINLSDYITQNPPH